ncbi:benzyl alcohol O-benzoyltransferase-like [Amaranthus tricolor]|uniref:benzyl alcohol O-benzoyltransferase-like n=1 Tax=Amaranthus tricolor TaxID=29722 RepID=UPI00258E0A7A|nr:benzyl alcohol O-benzoyltransferase-like [Amaranthus tricolor]
MSSFVFNVTRHAPELLPPAEQTPYEFKELSDIDDQDGLRFHIPSFLIYEHSGDQNDPVMVIKKAVAKALVSYYPFAGRLREKEGRKLVVECNGEGIIFIEANANANLKIFGYPLLPPFPCLDELLWHVPGSTDILDAPLMLIQVTRFKCGGFIFALQYNHTMADAQGIMLFLNAVAEHASGAQSLSTPPVWQRHLLNARKPPHVKFQHREYEEVLAETNDTLIPVNDLVDKSFFFGPKQIAALRRLIPPHQKASTFEILSACLWRCRTIALQLHPQQLVRFMCIVNSRNLFNPPLPPGYYGNGFAFPVALSTVSKLSRNPIGYSLNLIQQAKSAVTEEYMKSVADFMVLNGRPRFSTSISSFIVSDVTRSGSDNLDLGWGSPVYGGPAKGGVGAVPGISSFYIPFKNVNGEKGIVVPLCLPANAMEIFVKEINGLLGSVLNSPNKGHGSSILISSL